MGKLQIWILSSLFSFIHLHLKGIGDHLYLGPSSRGISPRRATSIMPQLFDLSNAKAQHTLGQGLNGLSYHIDPANALETSGFNDFDTSIFVIIVSSMSPAMQRSGTLDSPLPEEWIPYLHLLILPSVLIVNTFLG